MARGWESKSVEEQQAEASLKKAIPKARLTPEQAAMVRKVDGLQLSRQRVLQQLQNACDSRLRQMLEQALADLDQQISAAKASS
jgi:predicted component of type VI protein secretion system